MKEGELATALGVGFRQTGVDVAGWHSYDYFDDKFVNELFFGVCEDVST